MLRKVKKWLGIEGVRIDVEIPEDIFLREKKVSGSLVIESRQENIISEIRMSLIEKYSRGRGQNKLIDEYILGNITLDGPVIIEAGIPEIIPFDLPFSPLLSKMDKLGSSNILMKGLVSSAKFLRNVSSDYRIEIEADVPGMAISPLVKKPVKIIM